MRGLDADSNTTFLSIWLQSIDRPTDSLLLIYHFNASGLDRLVIYESNVVDWRVSAINLGHGLTNITNLQKLLVDQHTEFAPWLYVSWCHCSSHFTEFHYNIPRIWSMEGRNKRCCRWIAHAAKYTVLPALACGTVIFLILYIIIVGTAHHDL